jgi:hypothetical protein
MTRMETRGERLNRAYERAYIPQFNPLISRLDRPDFERFMGDATEAERAEMSKRETYVKPPPVLPKPAGSYAPFWFIGLPLLAFLLGVPVCVFILRGVGVL